MVLPADFGFGLEVSPVDFLDGVTCGFSLMVVPADFGFGSFVSPADLP